MNHDKGEKPVTLNQLGILLEKFFTPVYTRLDRLEKNQLQHKDATDQLKDDVVQLKDDVVQLKDDVDQLTRIQLRMENKIDDQIKLLHDRDDVHDKKLKEHDKRINRLEKTV